MNLITLKVPHSNSHIYHNDLSIQTVTHFLFCYYYYFAGKRELERAQSSTWTWNVQCVSRLISVCALILRPVSATLTRKRAELKLAVVWRRLCLAQSRGGGGHRKSGALARLSSFEPACGRCVHCGDCAISTAAAAELNERSHSRQVDAVSAFLWICNSNSRDDNDDELTKMTLCTARDINQFASCCAVTAAVVNCVFTRSFNLCYATTWLIPNQYTLILIHFATTFCCPWRHIQITVDL